MKRGRGHDLPGVGKKKGGGVMTYLELAKKGGRGHDLPGVGKKRGVGS